MSAPADSAEERWLARLRERRREGALHVAALEDVEALIAARDEARAEVERLRAERDEALYALDSEKMARYGREMDAYDDLSESRVEVERLREALRAIAAGFDPITGSVDDPSAKQVDGYYRGYAMAALEKGGK